MNLALALFTANASKRVIAQSTQHRNFRKNIIESRGEHTNIMQFWPEQSSCYEKTSSEHYHRLSVLIGSHQIIVAAPFIVAQATAAWLIIVAAAFYKTAFDSIIAHLTSSSWPR